MTSVKYNYFFLPILKITVTFWTLIIGILVFQLMSKAVKVKKNMMILF